MEEFSSADSLKPALPGHTGAGGGIEAAECPGPAVELELVAL